MDPQAFAEKWLTEFAEAISSAKVDAIISLFLPHGWFRDELVFSWDTRSLEGHERIRAFLSERLPNVSIRQVTLDNRQSLTPSFFPASPGVSGVQFAFKFESPAILGRGFVRLLPTEDKANGYKAITVFTTVGEIKGHEEAGHETGVYGGHTLLWQDIRKERLALIEADHHVLVVGAGQTGLQIAARLKQFGISALIIDKNARIGDNWRKRYPSLTLHTTRSHHQLLYTPYPKNWPIYTPRDRLALWLEFYAEIQDLAVWTSTELIPTPKYDPSTKRWTAAVIRNGVQLTLHPAHIVYATGTLGRPRVPTFPGQDVFKGEKLHSSVYPGGHIYKDKRVVVIGAGNTSADLCQDLAFWGADVTMVQRSSTCIVSAAWVKKGMDISFPDGVPTEVNDFKVAAMPLGLLKIIQKGLQAEALEFDKELHGGLRQAGFQLNQGPDGAGQLIMVFEESAGYWLDVGCGALIANGTVKLKSGQHIARLKEDGIVFSDGTELLADVIILATGYDKMREVAKGIFGEDVIAQTSEVWGLDAEGETRGCYRPSGYPGLWYAAGDFWNSRYQSRQMALLIKADQLGILKYPGAGATPEAAVKAETNGSTYT